MATTPILIQRARKDRSFDQRVRIMPGGLTLRRHPRGELPALHRLDDETKASLRAARLEIRVRYPAAGVVSVAPSADSDPESPPAPSVREARERLRAMVTAGLAKSVELVEDPCLGDLASDAPLVYDGFVVVRFESKPTPPVWAKFETLTTGAARRQLPYVEEPALAFALTPAASDFQAGLRLAEACLALEGVDYAYPVLSQPSADGGNPPPPRISPEEWHWGTLRRVQPSQGATASLEAAWPSSSYGAGQVIAVVERDGPIDRSHVQLRDRLVGAVDVTLGTQEPLSDQRAPTRDDSAHATMVAGLCCASGIAHGPSDMPLSAVGSAPRAQLLSVLAEDGLGSLAEADAIYVAWARGATVINCSWGLAEADGYHTLAPHLDWAISFVTRGSRARPGSVVLFSAGNGRESGQTTALSGYLRHPCVVVVTACGPDGRATPYANPGREIHVAMCAGTDANLLHTLDMTGELPVSGKPSPQGDYTRRRGQTSAACAMAAGVAALVRAANPQLTPAQVRDVLWQSADPLGTRRRGGAPDIDFGAGCVNPAAAVALARRFNSSP